MTAHTSMPFLLWNFTSKLDNLPSLHKSNFVSIRISDSSSPGRLGRLTSKPPWFLVPHGQIFLPHQNGSSNILEIGVEAHFDIVSEGDSIRSILFCPQPSVLSRLREGEAKFHSSKHTPQACLPCWFEILLVAYGVGPWNAHLERICITLP